MISFIFSHFLTAAVCLHILHFLTTDSGLPHLQAGPHQHPLTKTIFPRLTTSSFWGPSSPHSHSPQPSKNLDHPSPGPSFSLGNISRFILSLSFPCQGAGESLFICSPPALLSPILVRSHHVSLYKHSCHVTSSSSGSQGRPGLGSGKGSTYMESESVSAPAGRTAWPGLLTFLKLLSLESECTHRRLKDACRYDCSWFQAPGTHGCVSSGRNLALPGTAHPVSPTTAPLSLSKKHCSHLLPV